MAEQGPSCSRSWDQQAYPSKEMNGVVQVLGWLVIKHKFYHRQRHAKLHTALNVVCESFSDVMTGETHHLLTMVSLLLKAHTEEGTVRANLRRLVVLLERAILFPELAGLRDRLHSLIIEAKCQAVLQFCHTSSLNEEGLTLFAEYFNSPQSMNSEVGRKLCRLLNQKSARSGDTERFISEHSLSQFAEDLREFLTSAINQLTSLHIYNGFEDQVKSHCGNGLLAAIVANGGGVRAQNEEEEEEEEVEEEEEEEGRGELEAVRGDRVNEVQMVVQETQEERGREGERGREEERGREGERGREEEREEEEVEEGERSEAEEMEDEEGDSDSEYITRRKKPRGQVIEWNSSSELTDVDTPPSRLPERLQRRIVIRSKRSLLSSNTSPSGSKNLWTTEETNKLLKGVKKYGPGKWKKILDTYSFAPYRTTTSLKDKWRNIQGRNNN